MSIKKRKYPLIYASKHAIPFRKDRPLQFLLTIYIMVFAVLSLKPVNLSEWWFENLGSALIIAALIMLYRKSRLTNLSYVCVLAFLILHSVGAHYTYSLCPVGEWMKAWFGFRRNNYDRLVGFAFGVFMSMPVMEVLYHRFRLRYIEACVLSIFIIVAFCALSSLAEMYTAEILSSQQAGIFMGVQGDVWDSQNDMSMGLLGALVNMGNCIILKLRKNQKIHMVKYRNS